MINDEGQMSHSKLEVYKAISEIKGFLDYARGSESKKGNTITYHDYRHFSSITVKGNATDINTINKSIKREDWDTYEDDSDLPDILKGLPA